MGGGGEWRGRSSNGCSENYFFVFSLSQKGVCVWGGGALCNYKSSKIVTQEKTFQIKCFPEKNIWQWLALVFPNNH